MRATRAERRAAGKALRDQVPTGHREFAFWDGQDAVIVGKPL